MFQSDKGIQKGILMDVHSPYFYFKTTSSQVHPPQVTHYFSPLVPGPPHPLVGECTAHRILVNLHRSPCALGACHHDDASLDPQFPPEWPQRERGRKPTGVMKYETNPNFHARICFLQSFAEKLGFFVEKAWRLRAPPFLFNIELQTVAGVQKITQAP